MCPSTSVRNLVATSMLSLLCLTGCQDYKWQWSFETADQLAKTEKQAQEQHKLVFIFYKSYLDSEANRMHGDVLSDNQVGALFNDSVNILLDKAAGPAYEQYLARYGVTAPPACVLLGPDGRYKVFKGYIAKDRFIDMVKDAKIELLEQTRRAAPSKVSP